MIDYNILTFHDALSYGAVLQAYALQTFIESFGYTAGVFDYREKDNGRVSLKSKLKQLFLELSANEREVLLQKFESFRQIALHLNLEEDCKVFIAGSDQVWSPKGKMNPTYFLAQVGEGSIRASYAASLGTDTIPSDKFRRFMNYMKRMDYISVRENSAVSAIQMEDIKRCEVHIDPTLLLSSEQWRKIEKPVVGAPTRYILVYALHRPGNMNSLLKWLKKQTGADILLIDGQGYLSHVIRHDVVMKTVGPEEFLWLVDHAESVVTTSFHGTAFSIVFQKEFYTITNTKNSSRIIHLLNLLGLSAVDENETVFRQNNCVDWDCVRQVINSEKKRSRDYITMLHDTDVNTIRKAHVEASMECTGCQTCAAVCPKSAISMVRNDEGFLRPVVDEALCVSCHICQERCPINFKFSSNLNLRKAYYGWNKSDVLRVSGSSGGIFRALADEILTDKGVVYGAVYGEDFKSVYICSSDEAAIDKMQKSKYVFSDVKKSYSEVKEHLNSGRKVLFCGSPCQCAGLKSYLGKSYENLILCDFVCGGMPSPAFYRQYLDELERKYQSKIAEVDFRPKEKGWGPKDFLISFKNGKRYYVKAARDPYYKAFAVDHISVMEACSICQYKTMHVSDITLADFWGYKGAGIRHDDRGLSLIIANTEKGIRALETNSFIEIHSLDFSAAEYAFVQDKTAYSFMDRRNQFFQCASQIGFLDAARRMIDVKKSTYMINGIKAKLRRIL